MKRIEKLAVVAVALLVVCRLVPIFSNRLFASLYGENFASGISFLQRLSAAGMLPLLILINIAIGTWLFCESKRDGMTPWVWFLFGFVFQLPAVAVFYLIRIYDLLKRQQDTTSEQAGSTVPSGARGRTPEVP